MVLLICTAIFVSADVAVKDLDGTNVEIIYTHIDDTSADVNVIGSFNDWTEPGDPMTKNADGVWEFRYTAFADDEIQYKFFIDGNYVPDANAPDEKDDGFAGMNGLIIVADLLAEAAAAPAVSADGEVVPVEKVYKSKLNFGMYTIVGSKSTFSTQGVVDKTDKGFETDSTGLYAKSYWKIGGTIVPDVKTWFELKVLDSYQPIWEQDSRGIISPDVNDGLSSSVGGLLVNPINYLGGNNPELNSVKLGLDSPYVNWETGYGYAAAQGRTALLWETLEKKDGGNGYMRFDLGPELQNIGSFKVEATVAPNVMTENYALYSWLGATSGATSFDFQYDFKSAAKEDLGTIFDKLYHQDFIVGGKTKVANIDISAQTLINVFSETDFDVEDHVAGEIKLSSSFSEDKYGATVGYKYIGSGSEMLYGNNGDYLDDKGSQRISLDIYTNIVEDMKIGLDNNVKLVDEANNDSVSNLFIGPYVDIELKNLDATLKTYAKIDYILSDGFTHDGNGEKLQLTELGANFNINDMDFKYGLNNSDKDKMYNTLITSLKLPNNINAEIGLGLRTVRNDADQTVKDENNLIGFSLGGSWKIPVRKIKTPLLYGAFVYNMDPYDDETNGLEMDGYTTTDGVSKGDGSAQLRILVKWDF